MTAEPGQAREEIEETAATWIARRGGEAWTPADEAALNAWLAASPYHRVVYFRLEAVWDKAGRLEPVRRFTRFWPVAIAASVVALAAGIVFFRQSGVFLSPAVPIVPVAQRIETVTDETPAAAPAATIAPVAPAEASAPVSQLSFRQRYDTAIGASRIVSLPDGSRVTLDTDTELRVSMDSRSRTVHLDRGQVFFEVAHDPKRPFVVHTERLSVTAVGTAFLVRRVATDVRVVVAEGTVKLEGERLLSAGGIAHVEDDTVQIQQATGTEVERNLSWRSGVLTFRHASLTEAVAEMNRYGSRKIIILDPAIASLQLGGIFRTDEVESFVHLLERTFPIDAALHPDRIELTVRSSP